MNPRAILFLTSSLVFSVFLSAAALGLTLSSDGQTRYVIVVANDAIAPEKTAASELAEHLNKVTGAEFKIVAPDAVPTGALRIVVGPCEAFRKAFPDINMKNLGHDGIVMKTVGDTIYLAGGRPRGTLYAVYTFLEDIVGCRWWTSRESFIPKRPTLEIPDLDKIYVPKLRYREAFYRDMFNGVFAARCKCNGHFEHIPDKYGGHYTILGWCHTFYQLIPPSRYFAAHPEWFSLVKGKRTADNAQLCLTNPEVRAELTKNALKWIRKTPNAGLISISQNDCHRNCQCPKCRKLEEQEGSPSGPLLHFVNAVAAEIEKQYPDMLVMTLAYQYTRKPPRHVRPRRNVVIRLCSIECSFAQPLGTGPQNVKFRNDIDAWSRIARRLYIWNYVTNFQNYILPHPNMRSLAKDIRFFVDKHAIGLFEQGDAGSGCGDFIELRAWLLAHLMWDPSRNEDQLIDEFLNGYYGPAAEPIRQYLDLIHDSAEKSGVYLRCFMRTTKDWMPPDVVFKATALFDEAEKRVKNDPTLAFRVRRARMPLNNVWLRRYDELKAYAKKNNVPFPGPADPKAFCRNFIKAAYEFNVGQYREGRSFAQYEKQLRKKFQLGEPKK